MVDEISRSLPGMSQDFDQGGSRRRNQFSLNIRRIPGNSGQKFCRCRGRYGHNAVSTADEAASSMKGRRADLFDAQVVQTPNGTDDIQDAVDGTDFMEVDVFVQVPMHLASASAKA